ncbi:MAG: acetate--CoA ligase family protein, partial [Candidatus Binataceae bacterium]
MNERTVEELIASAIADDRSALSEIDAKLLLRAAGIAVAIPDQARSADEAAAAAARRGFPAVLKVISPQVSHKSEVGGVVLNLNSEGEVRAAFERIRRDLEARATGAQFDGVAVDTMARPGVELIVGIVRDERFGPLVVTGLGGVFVEVFADTVFRLAPIDHREARAMLDELRGGAIQHGLRGAPPIDFEAVAALLARLSAFAAAHPEVKEMDLNPIVAHEHGLAILDARVLLESAPISAASVDPNRTRRVENLAQAFTARTVAVIGDKRVGGYMWLRAMKRFTGKLYSVQIDPNEIPGIEAMGIANYKSLAEVPEEKIDYAVSAVPRQVA